MKRIFGTRKPQAPAPTLEQATDKLSTRGDTLDEKIKKLDQQLMQFREQMRRTRPGPAQDAIKRRALTVLKQKKMYEQQRNQLANQQFNVENTSFALESAKINVEQVQAMQAASKELKTTLKKNKELNIDKIDTLNDELADFMDMHNEIQDALGTNYATPEMDEDELFEEFDALEGELMGEGGMGSAAGEGGQPSYLDEPDLPELPAALPAGGGGGMQPAGGAVEEDPFGLPAVPQRT